MIRALLMATILCLLLAVDTAAADLRCADGESGDACRRMLAVARDSAFRSKADTNDIRTIQGHDAMGFEPSDILAARAWVKQDPASALPVLRDLAASRQAWVSLFGRLVLVDAGELAFTQANFPDAWRVDGQPSLGLFRILQWLNSPTADAVAQSALAGAESDIDYACLLSGYLYDNPRQRMAPWLLAWTKRILTAIPLAEQPQLADFTQESTPARLSRVSCIVSTLTPLWSKLPEQTELNLWMTQQPNRVYQFIGAMRQKEAGDPAAARQWPALLRKEGQPKLDALAADLEADLAHND